MPLDLSAGQALRDAAIALVDAADPDFVARALGALQRVAYRQPELTTDDVWVELGSAPRERRAMGAVMQRGKRLGYIRSTKRMQQSAQPQCHARPKQVWVSLVWRP